MSHSMCGGYGPDKVKSEKISHVVTWHALPEEVLALEVPLTLVYIHEHKYLLISKYNIFFVS